MKSRIEVNADKTTPEKLLNLRNLNQLKKINTIQSFPKIG